MSKRTFYSEMYLLQNLYLALVELEPYVRNNQIKNSVLSHLNLATYNTSFSQRMLRNKGWS